MNGKRQANYDHCFSMGSPSRPGAEQDPTIAIAIPGNFYTVVSYADNACQASLLPLGGGSSLVSSRYHDWTVFAR